MNNPMPAVYEIRVKGSLNRATWAAQFDRMEISNETPGETRLIGMVEDQAALYGLLARLRNLALPLISVQRIDG